MVSLVDSANAPISGARILWRGTNAEPRDAETVTGHSFNWGGVLHLNRLFKNDPLPINIGVSYTKSDNFQVTSIRRDLYGRRSQIDRWELGR